MKHLILQRESGDHQAAVAIMSVAVWAEADATLIAVKTWRWVAVVNIGKVLVEIQIHFVEVKNKQLTFPFLLSPFSLPYTLE
jgi:hypothetical protein